MAGHHYPTPLLRTLLHFLLLASTLATRVLHFQTTHKMGTLLLQRFAKRRFSDSKIRFRNRISPHVIRPTVVLARDIFDATVSGYLYHKAGHECWLDSGNRVNPVPRGGNDWLRREDWTQYVSTVPVQNMSFPEYNLCEALNATDERVGLGIYLEFARNRFYQSAVELSAKPEDPTLFLCFDDLLSDWRRDLTGPILF